MFKYCLLILTLHIAIRSQDTIKVAYIKSGEIDEFRLKHFFIDRSFIYDLLYHKIDQNATSSISKNGNSITIRPNEEPTNISSTLPKKLFRLRDIYQRNRYYKYYQYQYLENVDVNEQEIKISLNKRYKDFIIPEHLLNSLFYSGKENTVKFSERLYVNLVPYSNEVDIINDLDRGSIDVFQYTQIPKFIDLNQRNINLVFRKYEINREDNSWIGLFLNSGKLSLKLRSKLKKSFNRDFLIKKFSQFLPEKTNSLFRTESSYYFNREVPVYDPIDVINSLKKKEVKQLRLIYPLHSEVLAYIAGEISIQLSEVGLLVQPMGVSLQEYLFRLKEKQYEIAIANMFYLESEYIDLFNLVDNYLTMPKNFKKYLRTLEQIDTDSKVAIIHKLQDIIEKSDKIIPLFMFQKQHFLINRKYKRIVESEKKSQSGFIQRLKDLSEWLYYE